MLLGWYSVRPAAQQCRLGKRARKAEGGGRCETPHVSRAYMHMHSGLIIVDSLAETIRYTDHWAPVVRRSHDSWDCLGALFTRFRAVHVW